LNTIQKRAFTWWDKLPMTNKVWFGQMYGELLTNRQMICLAYQEHVIEKRNHLRVVK